METVKIKITGTMPLLMHADSIEWADKMDEWKNNPDNKAKSKAGDDRTPPWRWIGCLNFTDPQTGVVIIPSEYIMRALMGGGAEVPTGKGQKTFKSQSQSGLLIRDFGWPLSVRGKTVPMESVQKCMRLKTFPENMQVAQELGFLLFVRRARIGQAKHIRVRPRFDDWSATGEIVITDESITLKVLKQILDIAGSRKGIGDWRPSAPTPGPFGQFTAEIL